MLTVFLISKILYSKLISSNVEVFINSYQSPNLQVLYNQYVIAVDEKFILIVFGLLFLLAVRIVSEHDEQSNEKYCQTLYFYVFNTWKLINKIDNENNKLLRFKYIMTPYTDLSDFYQYIYPFKPNWDSSFAYNWFRYKNEGRNMKIVDILDSNADIVNQCISKRIKLSKVADIFEFVIEYLYDECVLSKDEFLISQLHISDDNKFVLLELITDRISELSIISNVKSKSKSNYVGKIKSIMRSFFQNNNILILTIFVLTLVFLIGATIFEGQAFLVWFTAMCGVICAFKFKS